MKNKYIYIISLFFIFQIMSCNLLKKSNIEQNEISKGNSSKIIFLNYSIKKQGEEYKVSLLNKTISKGKLKKQSLNLQKIKNKDIEYFVLDKKYNVLQSNYISNPLIVNVEYVSEEGILAKKTIELDSTTFFLRIQIDERTKYVNIKRYNINKSIDLLTSNIKHDE